MRMNPIKRNIAITILCFLGFMLGTALTINTFVLVFNYPSKFWYLFKLSFLPFLILFIIMFTFLYTKPKIFNKMYYYLAILLGLYMYNFWTFLIYIFINVIINPGVFINLLIFLSGLGLTIYGIINDRNPQFDKQVIKCSKLPKEDSLTIIHLTDMHLGACYDEKFVEMIVNKILDYERNEGQKIDFIVITGDLIDANIKVTKEMLEPFKQITCPIYYVSGNHEDYTWIEEAFNMIENETNLTHLSNNYITYNNKVNVIGIDYDFNSDLSKNNLRNLSESIKNSEYNDLANIFLYHSPFLKMEQLKEYNIFLFLCGHIHGGQFFPFSLMRHCLGKKYILEGLYKSENNEGRVEFGNGGDCSYAYCCSGTGTQGPCTRTFITPNIGIIRIEGQK